MGALLEISDVGSEKSYLPTYDGNGNVATVINADTGAISATYEYSPCGELLRSNSADAAIVDQPFRFSTKYYDQESHLCYYGHRYYDPQTGRFVCRDPEEESGGTNLYAFLANDPIDKWDYLGWQSNGEIDPGDDYFSASSSYWGGYFGASSGGWGGVVGAKGGIVYSPGGGGIGYYGNSTIIGDGGNGLGLGASGDGSSGGGLNLTSIGSGGDSGGNNGSPTIYPSVTVQTPNTPTTNNPAPQGPGECGGIKANYTFALASAATYPDLSVNMPSGTTIPALNQLPDNLQAMIDGTAPSHIHIAVYQDTATNQYIVAFRGTFDRNDVRTDVVNAMGDVAAQYQDAITFARQFTTLYGNNVLFTGHSLGGGLAAAAALTTQLNAITFNAAGPSLALGLPTANATSLIVNYHTTLDPVTTAQNSRNLLGVGFFGPFVGPVLAGSVRSALGDQVNVPFVPLAGVATSTFVQRHSMVNMLNNLKALYKSKGCGEL